MKHDAKGLAARIIGDAVILLSAFSLLFPISASVLCIAPGSHVAIEELNAGCCASSAVSTRKDHHPGNGLNAANDCRNCTDILISLNEPGPIPESYGAAAGPLTNDCFEDSLLLITASHLFRQSALNAVDTSPPASSSVPLRC